MIYTKELRDELIAKGVRNLNEYGFAGCTADNLLTDMVYKEFFAGMLREARGQGAAADHAIDGLLNDLASPTKR